MIPYQYFSFIIIGAIFLRLLPRLLSGTNIGADHWFWNLYIETYRNNRIFPPIISEYLLDEKQWYPPLFPLLISKLPKPIFDRLNFIIAILIDILRMMLMMTLLWIFNKDIQIICIAGIIYGLTPMLISYNMQLNPRGLGALFLDLLIVLIMIINQKSGPLWLWAIVSLLSGLILLTHKMTTQIFWFLCIAAGILLKEWIYFALIPTSMLIALIISKGFYINVLRAHWDIVTFWNRNWRKLQAHPIKESPIYGEPGYETPGKFHKKGIKGVLRHLFYLWGFNPSLWVLLFFCLLLLIISKNSHISNFDYWLLGWTFCITLFALATTFLPVLKCLGGGYLYLYNAAFPSAILITLILEINKSYSVFVFIFVVSLIANLSVIISYYFKTSKRNTQSKDLEFDSAIEYLKNALPGVIMCLPFTFCDVIAYKTRKTVLFGAHGFGFKLLEPIFPVLLLPFSEIYKRYNVIYLLTIDSYLPQEIAKEIPFSEIIKFGKYTIYCR